MGNTTVELTDKKKWLDTLNEINSLPKERQKYLYGECDYWVRDNYKDGLEIVAIMQKDNHEDGITHCYLRNPDNGLCYDVRGEKKTDEDILCYTGIDYFSSNTEEYVFQNLEDFEAYIKWIEFETEKQDYLR